MFHIANIVTNLTETEQQRDSFKLPSPSRQDIVNWIAEGINYLKNHPDMIENSFRVCGITTNDLNSLKKSSTHKLTDEEEEVLENEDPFSCI